MDFLSKNHKNFENTLFWSISSLSNGGLSKKSFVAILAEVEHCQFWISYEGGFAMAFMPANNVVFVAFVACLGNTMLLFKKFTKIRRFFISWSPLYFKKKRSYGHLKNESFWFILPYLLHLCLKMRGCWKIRQIEGWKSQKSVIFQVAITSFLFEV